MTPKLKKNKENQKNKKNNSALPKKSKNSSFEILNPATLTKIGELPLYTTEMVEEKILLAKQAQIIWSAKSLRQRDRKSVV